ncbi:MAG: glycosyltransferase [Candidatus Acidiferrales bacterium]
MKILHVEVGGSYGGSLRALEFYLSHSTNSRLQHDVLLYFPTSHSERLVPHVGNLRILYPKLSSQSEKNAAATDDHWRNRFRSASPRWVSELKKWIRGALGFPTAFHIRQVIRDGNYDVVHVNNTFTYQIPTLIGARLGRTPVVAHVRNPVDNGGLARRLLRAIDRLVCVNDTLRKSFAEWTTGLTVVTCRDAVEEITFNKEASGALRQSLASNEDLLVGSLGRLEIQKGFVFLANAARQVIDRIPNVKFAIAGDGSERGHLETLIRTLGIEKSFSILDFRNDVGNFIGALDVFVVCSLWEGGPLTALEAMQLRKPIVTTPVGFMPELIRDHVNGILVPAADPESLAEGILELCQNEELRSSLAAAAPETVKPFRDRASLARELDAVFLSLAAEHGAP